MVVREEPEDTDQNLSPEPTSRCHYTVWCLTKRFDSDWSGRPTVAEVGGTSGLTTETTPWTDTLSSLPPLHVQGFSGLPGLCYFYEISLHWFRNVQSSPKHLDLFPEQLRERDSVVPKGLPHKSWSYWAVWGRR